MWTVHYKVADLTIEVMLGFFALEGNPLLRGKCIAAMYHCEYCIMREETVRERRGSYSGCAVGCIPSFAG
jgi:hypothetical protein